MIPVRTTYHHYYLPFTFTIIIIISSIIIVILPSRDSSSRRNHNPAVNSVKLLFSTIHQLAGKATTLWGETTREWTIYPSIHPSVHYFLSYFADPDDGPSEKLTDSIFLPTNNFSCQICFESAESRPEGPFSDEELKGGHLHTSFTKLPSTTCWFKEP